MASYLKDGKQDRVWECSQALRDWIMMLANPTDEQLMLLAAVQQFLGGEYVRKPVCSEHRRQDDATSQSA